MDIEYGYCHCGCGRKTNLATKKITKKGIVKGQPRKFLHGHHMGRGENSYFWKGGRSVGKHGYILVHAPGHPRAGRNGRVLEHIIIAEKALGKPIPYGSYVHHRHRFITNNALLPTIRGGRMPSNTGRGNMYEFIDETKNPIKGVCKYL